MLLRPFVRMVKPPRNVLGMSVLVRALAAGGGGQELERVRARLLELLRQHGKFEAAARYHLAHADRSAGEWRSAEENARIAGRELALSREVASAG
jgi:hypothetical protein